MITTNLNRVWAWSKDNNTFDEVSVLIKVIEPPVVVDSIVGNNGYSIQLNASTEQRNWEQNVVQFLPTREGQIISVLNLEVFFDDGSGKGTSISTDVIQDPASPMVALFSLTRDANALKTFATLDWYDSFPAVPQVNYYKEIGLDFFDPMTDFSLDIVGFGNGSHALFSAGKFDITIFGAHISAADGYSILQDYNLPAPITWNGMRPASATGENSNLVYDIMAVGTTAVNILAHVSGT